MITERQFAPNRFQHCATISKGPPGSGTFLAYYTGHTEMHRTQHVRVHWFSENGQEAQPIDLEEYTGNPVLLETLEGTKLIYSKFEVLTPRRVEWWQWCSLWNCSVDIKWIHGTPKIILGTPEQIVFEEPCDTETATPKGLGYLGRCNPIVCKDGGYLLPLYREHAPHFHGTILWSNDGVKWEYRSTVGKGKRCIQPTIFYNDDKLVCLLRNFSRSVEPYAYYSESLDHGKSWSKVTKAPYYNANNSITGINLQNLSTNCLNLVVWNNDPTGRNKITLGTFEETPQPIALLDGYGSYPSTCLEHNSKNSKLHIVYTTVPNPLKTPNVKTVIRWKQYNLEAVLEAGRKHNVWPNSSQNSSSSQASSPWGAVPPKNSLKPGDPSKQ